MKIIDGDIIPAVGIGNIKLNDRKEALLERIGNDYRERLRENDSIIEIENAAFWISNDGRIEQIGVTGDFKGKYKNVIGVGSTLEEVKKYVGSYIDVYGTYEMEEDKGICFELEDAEDWDELTTPINYIFVFGGNNATLRQFTKD
jgi:hypothetical protein